MRRMLLAAAVAAALAVTGCQLDTQEPPEQQGTGGSGPMGAPVGPPSWEEGENQRSTTGGAFGGGSQTGGETNIENTEAGPIPQGQEGENLHMKTPPKSQ